MMKNFLVLTVLFLSFPSFSQDDCSLNQEAIKGVLSGAQTKREKQGVTETLGLKNGIKITYQMGGCAHYAYSFTYEKFGKQKFTEKKLILALAEKLLKATPVKDTSHRNSLLEFIKEAGKSKDSLQHGQIRLPCGDANCAVDLSEAGKLKVGYDFAL